MSSPKHKCNMTKDDLIYVGHMLAIATKARSFIQGKDRTVFDNDEILQLALTHLLQTIGEAARHVSQPFRDAHPHIPWKAIMGMRHRVVHDYLNVDEDIVWRTLTHELVDLIRELEKIVPTEKSSNSPQGN
jgi:uncharacterized protein with HEPN domain